MSQLYNILRRCQQNNWWQMAVYLAGGLDYGAVSEAVRRMEIRRQQERALKTAFNRVLKMLNI